MVTNIDVRWKAHSITSTSHVFGLRPSAQLARCDFEGIASHHDAPDPFRQMQSCILRNGHRKGGIDLRRAFSNLGITRIHASGDNYLKE